MEKINHVPSLKSMRFHIERNLPLEYVFKNNVKYEVKRGKQQGMLNEIVSY